MALIVAGDRLDRCDNLFVRHILGGANETGVFAIEEQSKTAIRISPKGSQQLAAFGLSKRTEVHSRILLNERTGDGLRTIDWDRAWETLGR
jgi:hypothetical protein